MTGQNLIDFINEILDDEISDDLALDLINNAKNIIEGARKWRMLIKEDSSQTFGSGEDYTDAKDLPSDFFMDDMVYLGIEADEDYSEYDPIPFNQRRLFSQNGKYSIDYANDDIYICDKVDKTYTIYLYYIYETDDLTVSTSPVWPAKYHKLIGFLVAELYKTSIDFDDINVGQALAHNKQAALLWGSMQEWDSQLALKEIGNKAGIRGNKNINRTGIIQEI
uniref:Uncharacterized protein n=1 Tax=viral metagenome TaxID=1070528 RepID=A0A6H1ZYL1_9ZZZZ